MDLNELTSEWQQKKMPPRFDNALLKQVINFEENLTKENAKISYWLSGTIFLTGVFVTPFLNSGMLILILSGIWFLMGAQAILFWFRQMTITNSMTENPIKFIEAKLSKLKYNLLITNLFMPIYMILLGLLSSYYLYSVLEGVDENIVIFSIVFTWLFYIVIFFIVWSKQRRKDAKLIIPQIIELNKIKAGYNNV